MKKIKSFIESDTGKDLLTVFIVILVGIGSFELGRLSKDSNSNGLKLIYDGQNEALSSNMAAGIIMAPGESIIQDSQKISGKAFFASNRGTKYYPINCSAGKNIKQENRIWFNAREEAEREGYTLSASCE